VELVLASSPEKLHLQTAIVCLDTPYFVGKTEVVLMEKPIRPVLIGNYKRDESGGITAIPVYVVRNICAAGQSMCAAVVVNPSPKLSISDIGEGRGQPPKLRISDIGAITTEHLAEEQKKDPSLKKIRRVAEQPPRSRKGKKSANRSQYKWIKGLLYRVCSRGGKVYKQVVVPKKFRESVLTLAHEDPKIGHFECPGNQSADLG
jgi:hypothetical protein